MTKILEKLLNYAIPVVTVCKALLQDGITCVGPQCNSFNSERKRQRGKQLALSNVLVQSLCI